MQTKAKSLIILITTFLLGIILGVVGSNLFIPRHVRGKLDRMRTPEGFVAVYERIIQPAAAQKDTLDTILRNYFNRFNTRSAENYHQFRSLEDSLYQELQPLLTDEQQKRLEAYKQRVRKPRDSSNEHKHTRKDR